MAKKRTEYRDLRNAYLTKYEDDIASYIKEQNRIREELRKRYEAARAESELYKGLSDTQIGKLKSFQSYSDDKQDIADYARKTRELEELENIEGTFHKKYGNISKQEEEEDEKRRKLKENKTGFGLFLHDVKQNLNPLNNLKKPESKRFLTGLQQWSEQWIQKIHPFVDDIERGMTKEEDERYKKLTQEKRELEKPIIAKQMAEFDAQIDIVREKYNTAKDLFEEKYKEDYREGTIPSLDPTPESIAKRRQKNKESVSIGKLGQALNKLKKNRKKAKNFIEENDSLLDGFLEDWQGNLALQLPNLAYKIDLALIKNKEKNKKELTEAEQLQLKSYAMEQNLDMLDLDSDRFFYRNGKGLGNNVSFMAQIGLTLPVGGGGGAIGGALTKATTGAVARRIATKSLLKKGLSKAAVEPLVSRLTTKTLMANVGKQLSKGQLRKLSGINLLEKVVIGGADITAQSLSLPMSYDMGLTRFIGQTQIVTNDKGEKKVLLTKSGRKAFLVKAEARIEKLEQRSQELSSNTDKEEIDEIENEKKELLKNIQSLYDENTEKLIEDVGFRDAMLYGYIEGAKELAAEKYVGKLGSRAFKRTGKFLGEKIPGLQKNVFSPIGNATDRLWTKGERYVSNTGLGKLSSSAMYHTGVGKLWHGLPGEWAEEVAIQLTPSYTKNWKQDWKESVGELGKLSFHADVLFQTALLGGGFSTIGKSQHWVNYVASKKYRAKDKENRKVAKIIGDLYKDIDNSITDDDLVNHILMNVGNTMFNAVDIEKKIKTLEAQGKNEEANKIEKKTFLNIAIRALQTGTLDKFKNSLEKIAKKGTLSDKTRVNAVNALKDLPRLEGIKNKYQYHINRNKLINIAINKLLIDNNLVEINDEILKIQEEADTFVEEYKKQNNITEDFNLRDIKDKLLQDEDSKFYNFLTAILDTKEDSINKIVELNKLKDFNEQLKFEKSLELNRESSEKRKQELIKENRKKQIESISKITDKKELLALKKKLAKDKTHKSIGNKIDKQIEKIEKKPKKTNEEIEEKTDEENIKLTSDAVLFEKLNGIEEFFGKQDASETTEDNVVPKKQTKKGKQTPSTSKNKKKLNAQKSIKQKSSKVEAEETSGDNKQKRNDLSDINSETEGLIEDGVLGAVGITDDYTPEEEETIKYFTEIFNDIIDENPSLTFESIITSMSKKFPDKTKKTFYLLSEAYENTGRKIENSLAEIYKRVFLSSTNVDGFFKTKSTTSEKKATPVNKKTRVNPATSEREVIYSGFKTISPDIKTAYSGLPFKIIKEGKEIKMVTTSTVINKNSYPVLHRGNFKFGDEIKIEFDWNFFKNAKNEVADYYKVDSRTPTKLLKTVEAFIEKVYGSYSDFLEKIETKEGREEIMKNEKIIKYLPTNFVLKGEKINVGMNDYYWWNKGNVALPTDKETGMKLHETQERIIKEAREENMLVREKMISEGGSTTLIVAENREAFHNTILEKTKFNSLANAFDGKAETVADNVVFIVKVGDRLVNDKKEDVDTEFILNLEEWEDSNKTKNFEDGIGAILVENGVDKNGNITYIIRDYMNNHKSKQEEFKAQRDLLDDIENGTEKVITKEQRLAIIKILRNKHRIVPKSNFQERLGDFYPSATKNKNVYRQDFYITDGGIEKTVLNITDIKKHSDIKDFIDDIIKKGEFQTVKYKSILANNIHTQFIFTKITDKNHTPVWTTDSHRVITFDSVAEKEVEDLKTVEEEIAEEKSNIKDSRKLIKNWEKQLETTENESTKKDLKNVIKEITEHINRRKAYIKELSEDKKIKNKEVKKGVSEVFKENPELFNIGTQEQYSTYLETIFPDSKVKDILYRGAKKGLEFFTQIDEANNVKVSEFGFNYGIFLSSDKNYIDSEYGNNTLINKTYRVIINSSNIIKLNTPLQMEVAATAFLANELNPTDEAGWEDLSDTEKDLVYNKYLKDKNKNKIDTIIGNDANAIDTGVRDNINGLEYVVFEPEQIHILGSKQDIQGFKEFIKSKYSLKETTENKIFTETDLITATNELLQRILQNIDLNKDINRKNIEPLILKTFNEIIKELNKNGYTQEAKFLEENKASILGHNKNRKENNYDGSVRELLDILFDSTENEDYSENETKRQYNIESYEKNIKTSLSLKIKILLSGLTDTRIVEKGFAGFTKSLPFGQSVDALQQILASADNNSLEDIEISIKEKYKVNKKEFGFYLEILKRLKKIEKSNNSLVKKMMYKLYQPKVEMVFIMHSKNRKNEFLIQRYDSNSTSPEIKIKQKWNENQKFSSLYKIYSNGHYKIKKEVYSKVKNLFDKIKEKKSKASVTDIEDFLKYFGITLNKATLKSMKENLFDNSEYSLYMKGKGLVGKNSLLDALMGSLTIGLNIQNKGKTLVFERKNVDIGENIFFNILKYNTTKLKNLITVEKFVSFIPSQSMRIAGKTINSYAQPKRITNILNKLKKNKKYIALQKSSSINSESLTLELLEEIPEYREYYNIVNLSLDALKKADSNSSNNAKPQDLSERDWMVTAFGLFAHTDGKMERSESLREKDIPLRKGIIMFPTLSDSSQVPLVKTALIDLQQEDIVESGKLSDVILEFIYDKVVKGDIKRIAEFIKNGKKINIKNFNNGAEFILSMQSLNSLLLETVDNEGNKIKRPLIEVLKHYDNNINDVDAFYKKYKKEILEEIQKNVTSIVSEQIKRLEKTGLIEDNEISFIDSSYLKKKKVKGKELIDVVVNDYVVNYMIAQRDIQNTYAGDFASYFDTDIKDFEFGLPPVSLKDMIDYYYPNLKEKTKNTILNYKEYTPEILAFLEKNLPKLLSSREIASTSLNQRIEDINPIARIKFSEVIRDVHTNGSKRLKDLISPGSQFENSKKLGSSIQIMMKDVVGVSVDMHTYLENEYGNKYTQESREKVDELMTLDNAINSGRILSTEEMNNFNSLKEELINKFKNVGGYFNILSTDAAEYTTWLENLKQLLRKGDIEKEEYNYIHKKFTAQDKDLEEQGYISEENRWNKDEEKMRQKALMQPTKPMYSGLHIEKTNGIVISRDVYIKSASFPLIPELAEKFPKIKGLKNSLERIQKSNPGNTVRASYQSANKVGAVNNPISIKDLQKDYSKLTKGEKSSFTKKVNLAKVKLKKENFYIQQERTIKEKNRIKVASQMEKMILGDGISKAGYVFPIHMFDLSLLEDLNIKIKKDKINGKDLVTIYNELSKRTQELNTLRLYKEFNIENIDDFYQGEIKMMEKLAKILNKRLNKKQDRQGLELLYNVIKDGRVKKYTKKELQRENSERRINGKEILSPIKAGFKFPVYMMPNTYKFESVLLSIVSKKTINLTLPGNSTTISSQEGFDFNIKGKNYTIKDLKKLGFITTPNFDPKIGLKPNQVFITNKFKYYNQITKKEELIDLKDFINKKTNQIDFSKLPLELLTQFSLRIPTSAHQSGNLVEIAGFLPQELGDLMITSKDTIVHIGEDYDDDKRYNYTSHYFLTKEGTLKKLEYSDLKKEGISVVKAYDKYKEELKDTFYYISENLKTSEGSLKSELNIENSYWDLIRDKLVDMTILENNINNYESNELISSIFEEKYQLENLSKESLQEELVELKAELLSNLGEDYKEISKQLEKAFENELGKAWSKYQNTYFQKMEELKVVENNTISLYKTVYATKDTSINKLLKRELSMKKAEDTADFMEDKIGKSDIYYNIYSPNTQRDIFKLGADGAGAIGLHSNAVTINSLFQQSEFSHRIIEDFEEGEAVFYNIKLGHLTFDGVLGKTENNEVSELGMINQNSAMDNQKVSIMGRRNENPHTISALRILHANNVDGDKIKIEGKEYSYSSLFLNQPILREYSKLSEEETSSTKFNSSKKEEKITDILLKKYVKNIPDKYWETNEEGEILKGFLNSKAKDLIGKNLTSKNLADNLIDNFENVDHALQQWYVYSAFLDLKKAGKPYNALQQFINIESGALGISYFNVIDLMNNLIEIASGKSMITNANEMLGDLKVISRNSDKEQEEKLQKDGYIKLKSTEDDIYYIKPTTPYSHKIINSIKIAYNLYGNVFPYEHSNIDSIIQKVLMITKTSENNTIEMKYKIMKNLKDYVYTNNNKLFSENIEKERKELFFDDIEEKKESLASYLQKLQNNKDYSYFFNQLFFSNLEFTINNKDHPSLISYKNIDNSNIDNIHTHRQLLGFLNSNKPLPKRNGKNYTEANLMKDLTKYALLANQENGAIGFLSALPMQFLDKYNVPTAVSGSTNIDNPLIQNIIYNGFYKTLENLLGGPISNNKIKNKNKLDEKRIKNIVRIFNAELERRLGEKNILSITKENDITVKNYGGEILHSRFIRQLIQHNPEDINSLTRKELRTLYKTNKINQSNVDAGTVKSIVFESQEDYITLENSVGKLLLFEKKAENYYEQIPLKGSFGYNEFNYKEDTKNSLVESNNVKDKFVDKSMNTDLFVKLLTVQKQENVSIPKQIVKAIALQDSPYSALAKLVYNLGNIDDVKIEIKKLPKGRKASYNQKDKTITISTDIINEKTTRSEIQAIMMEEILHHVTTGIFNKYVSVSINGETGKITYIKKGVVPSELQTLITVYQKAFQHIAKKQGLSSLLNKITNRDELQAISGKKEEGLEAYRVQNIHEFMAGIFMKNESFAQEMANTQYLDSDKTILEKFVATLVKLFYKLLPNKRIDTISAEVVRQFHSLLVKEKAKRIELKSKYNTAKNNKVLDKAEKMINDNNTEFDNGLFKLNTKPADKKANIKWSVSNKYIGFLPTGMKVSLNPKSGESSTGSYALQLPKDKVNTGVYNSNDVVFASVSGGTYNKAKTSAYIKTISEIKKALDSGATVLLDNKEYAKKGYNKNGEGKLFEDLSNSGYKYSEKIIDGYKLGVWNNINDNKSTLNAPGVFQYDNLDNSNKVSYQNNTNQSIDDYVASEKTIRDLAAKIADRIGLKVRYESDRTKKYKGKLEGDTAVINLAHATLDTPVHEILGHPIIRTIKGTILSEADWANTLMSGQFPFEKDQDISPEGYKKYVEWKKSSNKLYQNLLKELETGKGKEVLDRIKRDYTVKVKEKDDYSGGDLTELSLLASEQDWSEEKYEKEKRKLGLVKRTETKYTLEEQQEEAIVELLGLMIAGKLDNVKDGKLISLLKRLLKEMKAFMRSLLNQKEVEIDKLPDNMTLGNIADLLAYSNSKLILPGNEVIYTTPDNQTFKTHEEASSHISKLTRLDEADLSKVNIEKELLHTHNSSLFTKENEVYYQTIIIFKHKTNSLWDAAINDNLLPNGKRISNSDNWDIVKKEAERYINSEGNTEYDRVEYKKQEYNLPLEFLNIDTFIERGENIKDFIDKNKEYEQSKEIIEEWKKVNDIKYDPEEVYSRGQGFYSVVGAYSEFDVKLMFQNLLAHIEDNKKSGGEFSISAFTKPIDKNIGHLEGGGGKIKFKIFPKSEDIKWAANTDAYSGSVWDASEKVNKDKKSEIIGVTYTKAPSMKHIKDVQPNLASIIDDLAHHHNELGIELKGNNFRLEYDKDIPYSTKKILDNINNILDQKYGKLIEPEITNNKSNIKITYVVHNNYVEFGMDVKDKEFTSKEEAQKHLESINYEDKQGDMAYYLYERKREIVEGKQPTQTKENLKESIVDIKNRLGIAESGSIRSLEAQVKAKKRAISILDGILTTSKDETKLKKANEEKTQFLKEVEILQDKIDNPEKIKEYTSQAKINTKVAALKEGQRKYPRSLIRSEVVPIKNNKKVVLFDSDDLPFQNVSGTNLNKIDYNNTNQSNKESQENNEDNKNYITQEDIDKLPQLNC